MNGDSDDQSSSRYEYYHDKYGFLINKSKYSSLSSVIPDSVWRYSYNIDGLLILVELGDDEVVTEKKYNNSGLISERNDSNRKVEYSYNTNELPIEAIIFYNDIPSTKMIIEYD